MYSIEQRDEQLLATTSAIRYHCFFDRVEQHLLRVRMEIDVDSPSITLVMPSWTPGSYKIREFVSHQGNLTVRDTNSNNVEYHWKTKNILIVNTDGLSTVVVEYTYYANERTVRTMHINRWRAFIMPVNCMMYVEGRMNEIHHVYLHHDKNRWKQVSSALSPIKELFDANEPIMLGALNYDILADSPIEIGNQQVQYFEACGAKHEVAVTSNIEVDMKWLTEQCKTIVEVEGSMFGGVPYDRYVFMIQIGSNVYGGLEHSRCSVNLIDSSAVLDYTKSGNLLALLCHEYFHTWNIKRIRPVEYGPFDYVNECYSPMLWLAEGFTSYYDDLLSYRCGFMSAEEYIASLGTEHLGKLERVPGRLAMSTRDASYLAWVKLYAQSPDGNNRHPSYYLKGGIITLLLELTIISESDCKYRLDDVMRELWTMYLERPEQGVTEEEVYSAIHRATGIDVRERMIYWLNSTEELEYNSLLNKFGLLYENQVVEPIIFNGVHTRLFTGLGLKEEAGKLIINAIEDASPAQLSGLSIDDELIAVNGIRVTTANGFTELTARYGVMKPVAITAVCDGLMYTTELSAVPRKEPRLSLKSVITEEQKRLLDFWLMR